MTIERFNEIAQTRGLSKGSHLCDDPHRCLLEAIAEARGMEVTDDQYRLGVFDARSLNDADWSTGSERTTQMMRLGQAMWGMWEWSDELLSRAAQAIALGTVRRVLPIALDAIGLQRQASACRDAEDLASAARAASDATSAASDAARAAARAASDATSDAARAASDATSDAASAASDARYAASDAARAARYAARYAASDAARAASDAASAASDAASAASDAARAASDAASDEALVAAVDVWVEALEVARCNARTEEG